MELMLTEFFISKKFLSIRNLKNFYSLSIASKDTEAVVNIIYYLHWLGKRIIQIGILKVEGL